MVQSRYLDPLDLRSRWLGLGLHVDIPRYMTCRSTNGSTSYVLHTCACRTHGGEISHKYIKQLLAAILPMDVQLYINSDNFSALSRNSYATCVALLLHVRTGLKCTCRNSYYGSRLQGPILQILLRSRSHVLKNPSAPMPSPIYR